MFLIETAPKGSLVDRVKLILADFDPDEKSHIAICGSYTFIENLQLNKHQAERLRITLESQGVQVWLITIKSEYGEEVQHEKHHGESAGLKILEYCLNSRYPISNTTRRTSAGKQ
jgi:hypothetical protein